MEFFVFISLGVFAGFTGGLFGVGGGVVVVPFLIVMFEYKGFPSQVLTHVAVATSLAAMLVTSFASAFAHNKHQTVSWVVFRWLALGVVVGSYLGVNLAINLTGGVLQVIFAVFLSYVALQMLVGFDFSANRTIPPGPHLTVVGALIGGVSMLFGIGGGSMTVPFLSWRGMTSQKAVGTSAALGIPIAIFGTILYMVNQPLNEGLPSQTLGYIYLPALLGLIIASVPAAAYGARLANKLSSKVLRRNFGLFVLLMSLGLIIKNIKGIA